MRLVAISVVLVACGTAAKPAPTGVTDPIVDDRPPPDARTPAADLVVVKASGAASRTPPSPRVVRRIVAARRGLVELVNGYSVVGLTVTEVVSGPIHDPDYAKRPIGTNHLEVLLVDEAAHAAPPDMDGFAGTWKLTRLADGTYIASAIEDTPFPQAAVAGRRRLIAQIRKDLRSPLPEQRLAGLDALAGHLFLELLPDVIPLLEDTRMHGSASPPPRVGSRVVGVVADETLKLLVGLLNDPATPRTGSPDEWAAFWANLTTRVEMPLAETPTTATEHVALATYQSWPVFASTPQGVVVGVSRLEKPLDGKEDGVFVTTAGQRTWLSQAVPEALDAISGAGATGVLYAESRAGWVFKLVDAGPPRTGAITSENATAAYNVLARSDTGYLVLGVDHKGLLALPLDAQGKPRGGSRRLGLPAPPAADLHRGLQPLSIARRDRGWLAVVNTKQGIAFVNVEETLRSVATTVISPATGIVQPKIAATGDRALVAWSTDRHGRVLETVVVDHAGKPLSAIAKTGSEVGFISQAVALDDGFAVAWIEAYNEVHVGRWNRDGALVANVVVQTMHAGPFALELAREASALVVTYLDQTRYPFPLVSRRLELAALN